MEEMILIAILAVLVGASGFGAIFAFVILLSWWQSPRYENDPNYKPKTKWELAREQEKWQRGWAQQNWLPKDLRTALRERPGVRDSILEDPRFPYVEDEMQKMDVRHEAGDPELCARAEKSGQLMSHWLRMTPEQVYVHFKEDWEKPGLTRTWPDDFPDSMRTIEQSETLRMIKQKYDQQKWTA